MSEPRLMLPFLGPVYGASRPLAWALVRFATGAALVPHGWGKIVEGKLPATAASFAKLGLEPAGLLALYIGLLELVGGTLLALGLLTRVWAAQVAGFMAVAAFHVHWPNGYFWTDKGWEYPAFWMLAAIALVIRGGGRLSLDRVIGREF